MTALGVLAFVVGLLVSIMLHEAGHLVTAKRFGMKATEYFVGFGPKLWSFRRGETEYGIKAIPAGGYVKITGMAQEEDLPEEDEPRSFYRKPAWQRAIVLGAGSAVHFLIAVMLLFVMASAIGLPGYTRIVAEVSPCVPQGGSAECTSGDPRSPAAQAGLREGDRIVAFAGERVGSWDELVSTIERHGSGEASMTVVRDGERRTVQADLASRGEGNGFLGVSPRVHHERLGPIQGVVFAGDSFGRFIVATAQVLASLPSAIPDLFSAERGEDTPGGAGVTSVVGVARASGGLFSEAGSWPLMLFLFSSIMVTVNISVGILNLLPLMPLDGGRLAVLGFERARTGLYRLFGRADPGPVDITKLLPVTSLVIILLVGFGVMLILADIVNPVTLF